MAKMVDTRAQIAIHLARAPIVGVVRTGSPEEAARQARALIKAGVELVEITFSVPRAAELVRELLAARRGEGAGAASPAIGMGTVSTPRRVKEALAAGAEFLVTPNVHAEVAARARDSGTFLVMGALTPTEIVVAHELGADLVKVYPLPPVGGPAYLSVVRQPLGDIPMLAAGGFGIEEIPAYRRAGATAFGLGYALLLGALEASQELAEPSADAAALARQRIGRALALAKGAAGEAPAHPGHGAGEEGR